MFTHTVESSRLGASQLDTADRSVLAPLCGRMAASDLLPPPHLSLRPRRLLAPPGLGPVWPFEADAGRMVSSITVVSNTVWRLRTRTIRPPVFWPQSYSYVTPSLRCLWGVAHSTCPEETFRGLPTGSLCFFSSRNALPLTPDTQVVILSSLLLLPPPSCPAATKAQFCSPMSLGSHCLLLNCY